MRSGAVLSLILAIAQLAPTLAAPLAAGPRPDLPAVRAHWERLSRSLESLQAPEGYWQGAIEADPSADVMPLLLQRKFGMLQPELAQETLARILHRQDPATGLWSAYPGGPPSADVTGMILLGLQGGLGLGAQDPRLSHAWAWFEGLGGAASLQTLNRMIAAFAGLVSEQGLPFLTTKFLALPQGFPLNIHNVGFGRSALIPLSVWQYYRQVRARGQKPKLLDPARVASAGALLGKFFSASFTARDLTRALKERRFKEIRRTARSPLERAMKFADALVPTSGELWAQEGLGWILSRQQEDGTWAGALQITYFSMFALQAAREAGALSEAQSRDLDERLGRVWKGLMAWRVKIPEGTTIQQSTVGPVMDTARILATRSMSREASERATDWLLSKQIFKKGDWSAMLPKLAPGGWTFEHFNDFYPDVDDTAMVLEALAERPQTDRTRASILSGAEWLLGLQNKDGGFPTWDRGTSKLFKWAIEKQVLKAPEVSDDSQGDITSRTLRTLAKLRSMHPPKDLAKKLERAVRKGCEFLEDHRLKTADGKLPLWRGEWMVNYTYGTSEAMSALLRSGCWDARKAAPYALWLASKQASSGGWGESPESYPQGRHVQAAPTLSQTEFVLASLIEYEANRYGSEPSVRQAIDSGVSYLLGRLEGQEFPYEAEFTGVYVRGVWYGRYVVLPHYEAVRVLRLYLDLNSQE